MPSGTSFWVYVLFEFGEVLTVNSFIFLAEGSNWIIGVDVVKHPFASRGWPGVFVFGSRLSPCQQSYALKIIFWISLHPTVRFCNGDQGLPACCVACGQPDTADHFAPVSQWPNSQRWPLGRVLCDLRVKKMCSHTSCNFPWRAL